MTSFSFASYADGISLLCRLGSLTVYQLAWSPTGRITATGGGDFFAVIDVSRFI